MPCLRPFKNLRNITTGEVVLRCTMYADVVMRSGRAAFGRDLGFREFLPLPQPISFYRQGGAATLPELLSQWHPLQCKIPLR